MRYIYIEFYDPTQLFGWDVADDLTIDDALIKGVVTELENTKNWVKVCMFSGGLGELVNTPFIIPKGCVKTIQKIKVVGVGKK